MKKIIAFTLSVTMTLCSMAQVYVNSGIIVDNHNDCNTYSGFGNGEGDRGNSGPCSNYGYDYQYDTPQHSQLATPLLEVHIQFWGDSYNINDNQANTANLANAGRWLKLNPNAHILVEAYADDLTPSGRYGEDRHNYNYSLAQKRSAAVITALEYYGASANQLTTRVVGDYEQYYIVYDYNRCVILKPGFE